MYKNRVSMGMVAAWLALPAVAWAACGSDGDGDGVCDNVDTCPYSVPGAVVNATGCPRGVPGDFDLDGDVDAADRTLMSTCLSGAELPILGPQCAVADLDQDQDVDMVDYGQFQGCVSGANVPASLACVASKAFISGGHLLVVGSPENDVIVLRLRGGWPTIVEIDFADDGYADFSFDRSQFTHIDVDAGDGNDLVKIDEINGIFTDTEITTLNGEGGDDTLIGGTGAERFTGGVGQDTIEGNAGNDTASMGAGDDVFQWDPGDGNDAVDGQAGNDTLVFNGSAAAEVYFLAAVVGRLQVIRDVGGVVEETIGVERVDLRALGGADSITINDLTTTAARQINIELEGTPGSGSGDGAADSVVVNATDGADNITIKGGGKNLTVAGLTAEVKLLSAEGNSDQLAIHAQSGNDAVDASGLAGGVAILSISGGAGNDKLIGSGGADFLFGDADNDTLIGGDGDDQAFGQAGDDHLVWNPGDDTDLNEGGDGTDTVEVNGGNGTEQFTTTANGTRVRFDRINPAPFSLDIGTCEKLVVNANGGDDSFSATGNLAVLIQITVDGGAGNDTLLGSNGIDLLLGGDGADFIDGQQGNDVAFLGAGDDVFQWDPGDGSDTVEGQDGQDVMLFNGSAGAEIFDLSPNGGRLRFTRNLGNIVMDVDDVEQVDLRTLGGIDGVVLHDLTGTDVVKFNVDLAGTIGGGAGDGAADTITVKGTDNEDILLPAVQNGNLVIDGLAVSVAVAHFEATDVVQVLGQGADDIIDATEVGPGGPALLIDGGSGDDILLGGAGADTINGGEGDDILLGGLGIDVLDGGLGQNVVIQDGISVSGNVVSLFGDDSANTSTITRDAAGQLFSNGVAIPGATIANTALIRVFGKDGADNIIVNEANGALPAVVLYGGKGIDSLTGGSGADFLFGGGQNDALLGKGGTDLLFGGADNDTLIGGDADDQAFGQAGDDRLIWNPGDDTDLNEGGDGTDTVEVNGGNGTEQFTTTANGTRVRFDRINPAPFSLDIGTCEKLVVNANGGDDSFSATGNLAVLIQITVDGGAGNDTLLGSNGIDLLLGGDGADFIDGQQGNDVAFLGAGDDVFQWDPGDGSDTVEGQDGQDVMLFNGSAGAEIFDLSPNGGRLRFTRNLGNIVMDVDDVEQVDLRTLGGIDGVVLHDLTGTDVVKFNVDLAGTIGGGAGDGAADTITVEGTSGKDIIDVTGAGTSVSVLGLHSAVAITNAEGANDLLVINALLDDDGITATTLPAGVIKLTLNGDQGNDTILGSQGTDVLLGGDGDDFIFGDNGDDTAFMGANDDVFQWNPGDGSDIVEGQDGSDTMLFFGSNGNENIDISPVGARVRFFRDVGSVSMDLNGVENVEFRALDGADNVVIGDLSGTDATKIALDLRGANGNGDGQADTVTVIGTAGDDSFGAAGDAGGVQVFGLHAQVSLFFQEAANDRLTLNGLGGNDVINTTSLAADGIQLNMNGGLGADVFLGGPVGEVVVGGDGDDTALLGAGDDTFIWNPGDDNDIIEGQDGFDTLQFNGANAAEHITIFANGGRVVFFRDIASVVMDLNDLERVNFNALGGADTIDVNDLSGTDVTQINLNLASAIGGGAGDGAADTVVVNGTSQDDTIVISGSAAGTSVFGLTTQINITGAEAANDRLAINALAGDDAVEGSGVAVGSIQLIIDGGDDDDVLIGGDGNDTILGGSGDDVLIGGAGVDVLDGGPGNNVVIQ